MAKTCMPVVPYTVPSLPRVRAVMERWSLNGVITRVTFRVFRSNSKSLGALASVWSGFMPLPLALVPTYSLSWWWTIDSGRRSLNKPRSDGSA